MEGPINFSTLCRLQLAGQVTKSAMDLAAAIYAQRTAKKVVMKGLIQRCCPSDLERTKALFKSHTCRSVYD